MEEQKVTRTVIIKEEDVSNILLGIILGGLAGIALGLLYAPYPGERTRAVLKERAVDLRDRANAAVDETRELINDMVDGISERGRAMFSEVGSQGRKEEIMEDVVGRTYDL